MNKEGVIKEIIKIIKKYLPDDYKILLFGSWTKENALKTSDIDIGILGKQKVPWETMVKILEEVENIPTLRKIDIVDLNSTEVNFKKSVLKEAKSLN